MFQILGYVAIALGIGYFIWAALVICGANRRQERMAAECRKERER